MSVKVITSSSYDEGISFSEPHLILVEGGDDQAVIAAMIRHEEVDGFRVHNMTGNSTWASRLAVIVKDSSFQDNVRSLGLVKDADTNPRATWDSCVGVLGALNLPVPTAVVTLARGNCSTVILVVPDNQSNGAIEELCFRAFDTSRLECVERYMACIRAAEDFRASGKNRIQAYLAGLRTAPRDIAVAANRNLLDMSDTAFDELRKFVRLLAGADSAVDASI